MSATLRFGTGTTVKDFAAYREWLAVAEDCGFDLLTTGDSQSLWADPFTIMTFAAERTTRPRLGVTVSNPMTRHPAVAASACAAVQQISCGRFAFGISSGDSALRNIGVRPATVAELEAYVVAVRELTAGASVEWNGATLALHWLAPGAPRVPVWMAAEGPRTQRLAGRIADGVVLSNCLTRDAYELATSNIAAGAAEVGRSLDDIEIWCMANVVFAPTEKEGIDQITWLLAGTANHVYRFHTEGKGLPPELVGPIRRLQAEYDSRHHAQRDTASQHSNAALVDKYGLRDYLAPRSTIAGPPERCVERLHEIAENGVRNLILAQFVENQQAWMRTVAETLLPPFR
ncbi:MAG TPA: LLM class flavin-dependent oxidoreductase [Acidimicrobiales bacterium]